jgi:hypothetical protein
MEMVEARAEYLKLLEKQISPEMRAAVPRVMDIMKSSAALETFSPSEWNGLKVKPIDFETAPGMPTSMPTRPRLDPTGTLRPRQEGIRSSGAIFLGIRRDKCTFAIASPLVIAPKATSPLIRFCGDYRAINEFITIPKHPIPIVQHELTKAAMFRYFVDPDMTNSFHHSPFRSRLGASFGLSSCLKELDQPPESSSSLSRRYPTSKLSLTGPASFSTIP